MGKGSKSIGAVILGGSGYGAGELLRFLSVHPEVEVAAVVSSSQPGTAVSAVHPHLREFCHLSFSKNFAPEMLEQYKHRVIFSSLPHGASAAAIAELYPLVDRKKLKIIDLSGDLRLRDPEIRRKHYPDAAVPQALVESFVYGLTELNRKEICLAGCISNPGCLASGCILAAAPLVAAGGLEFIHFDAKTGSSGAGRAAKAEFHHPELNSNAWAYKVLEHRHEPEIAQILNGCCQGGLDVSFVPHVIPASRGIYITAMSKTAAPASKEDLLVAYRDFYNSSPFVRVIDDIPQLRNVVTSNFCDITVRVRGRQVIVISALDNLVKGMVGQAIQNMNLMCGLVEEAGLWHPSAGPI